MIEQISFEGFQQNKDFLQDKRWHSLFSHCDKDLLQKFLKFDRENPELYKLFQTFALDAKLKGKRKRFSIWMIANRIRWYTQVETTGRDFKVSNDYLALYARKLIYDEPMFDGFFQLKAMKLRRSAPME